ncbi:NTP transferase domain-containing protein [Novosphingobium sp. YJ-S2-02]|uniref:NTP transferase domain-containing protein n=1 Tax=Novosphingobium aureum TaxID=2792964 RepID=A0A931HAD1_9SPHN|nr:NTP transferase domain-containing protein [Novosphingobium aureum]MBH0111861.1 NTP transferase domain-containing protein [Novosphingobium aureum]
MTAKASPALRNASADAARAGVRLIVLAGQHEGTRDTLSQRFAVSHRCLIPLGDRPLIAHVLHTGAQHPRIESLSVCIEREAFDPAWDVLTQLPGRGAVALVEAQTDLAASVELAAQGWDGPLLITTADHALLDRATIDAMLDTLDAQADVAFALAPREAVEAIDAGRQRHFLRLREGQFAPCDLYGVAGPQYLSPVSVFRGRRAGRHVGLRMLKALGMIGLLLSLFGLEPLSSALDRASRRFAMRIRAIVTADGSQAIDVGNDRSYAIVRDLLERRARDERSAQDKLAPVEHVARVRAAG